MVATSALQPMCTLSQSKTSRPRSGVVVTLPTWSSGRPLSALIARSDSRSGVAASAQKFPKA